MPIVNIPKGTPDWDIPINQNFETLQNEKVGLDSNGKIDKTLLPDDIGGGLENFQEKHTYAELAALIAENKLIPGMQYVLMDYQTKYIQPTTEVLKIMSIERLVLTAIDESHFAPECSSLSYPQDIVTYDFNMNKCEDNTTPRNGFITWRKSTNTSGNYAQISAPQDWRTMLWVRYKPDPDYYMVGSTKTQYEAWTKGKTVVQGKLYKYSNTIYIALKSATVSDIDDDAMSRICSINDTFLLNDIRIAYYNKQEIKLIKGSSFSEINSFNSDCKNIRFSDYHYNNVPHNNVFRGSCTDTALGASCTGNTFISMCTRNVLGNNCRNNLFLNQCRENELHDGCYDNYFLYVACYNILYRNCNSNVFHYYASNNILSKGCWRNNFMMNARHNDLGMSCYNNVIHTLSEYNRIGHMCHNNILGDSVSYNIIGNYCMDNIFNDDCYRNTIHSRVSDNIFGVGNSDNVIFPFCAGNTFGNYFSDKFVKRLANKNISNISALSNSTPYTIEKGASGKYYYWCLNSSGQMQSTLIP